MDKTPEDSTKISADIPAALQWVKDAPLFIDKANLDQIYDAVVRPAFNEGSRVIKISESLKKDLEKTFSGKTGISIPGWLSFIFSGEAGVSGEVKTGETKDRSNEQTVTLDPIKTPHRQLEQLTIYYLLQQPDRLLVGNRASPLDWQKQNLHERVPRALVFIDLPGGTKFIPMAAEYKDSKFVTFFNQLTAKSGERPPEMTIESQEQYWAWFDKNFDTAQAIELIEKAATQNGRIENHLVELGNRSIL